MNGGIAISGPSSRSDGPSPKGGAGTAAQNKKMPHDAPVAPSRSLRRFDWAGSVSGFLTLTLLGSLAACTKTSDTDEQWRRRFTTPHYSEARPIRGILSFGMEQSAIALCHDEDGRCRLSYEPYDGMPALCWLETSEKAGKVITGRLRTPGFQESLIVEGTGRVTVMNGVFGHMGVYPCQVMLDDVTATYDRPPKSWGDDVARHAFAPPPR